ELTEEEARTVLEALGLKNLERKLDEIDDKLSSSELDARREEARLKVARRQAAAVDRLVQNGARGDLWVTAEKDREVLAYARVSRTGTPCGWCAMLISRGPVYKTAGAATFGLDGEGDRYHDNCHCYAEPVFSLEQYEQDSRFDLNREYSRLWPRVTSGLSGKAALSAWRKYFRESNRHERPWRAPPSHVQEACVTSNGEQSSTEIAAALRKAEALQDGTDTASDSADGQAPEATEETAAPEAAEAEAPSAEGDGAPKQDEAPAAEETPDEEPEVDGDDDEEQDEPADEAGDELPDWARKKIEKLRSEAAARRKSLRETEAKVAELQAKVKELETRGLRDSVARKYNLPDALAKRLTGSTAEELEADAKELQKFVDPFAAVADELVGGLPPAREGAFDPSAEAR